MDLIDRQALTSEILGMTTFGNVHELDNFVHKCHLDGEHMGGLRDAVFAIVNAPAVQPEVLACGNGELNAQSEQRWIPCSERLPEVGTYVLISKKVWGFRSNLTNVCTAHISCDPRSGKEEWNDMLFGKLDDDKVLAWMPLPEPWKEGKQE